TRALYGTTAQTFTSTTKVRVLRYASISQTGVQPNGIFFFSNGSVAIGFPEGNFNSTGPSLTVGANSRADGSYSFAQGGSARAIAISSLASGNAVTTNGDNSQAFGDNTLSSAYDSMVIGRYNVGGGTNTSWVATDPIFEIGIGSGSGSL